MVAIFHVVDKVKIDRRHEMREGVLWPLGGTELTVIYKPKCLGSDPITPEPESRLHHVPALSLSFNSFISRMGITLLSQLHGWGLKAVKVTCT